MGYGKTGGDGAPGGAGPPAGDAAAGAPAGSEEAEGQARPDPPPAPLRPLAGGRLIYFEHVAIAVIWLLAVGAALFRLLG
ncbi:MAG TPA: hypothetical protein VFF98_12935 [Novosphingobium sp.]|nr:hypothetical protein [Novosphingobium sp.]